MNYTRQKYSKIFIMTLPRSGSTALGQILAGHPDVCHMGESMYWDLLSPVDIVCSCGKKNCKFLGDIYRNLKSRHAARPLLRFWQIIDKKYWPNKPRSNESLIPEGNKIPMKSSASYWLARCASSLDLIIKAYRQATRKKIYIDNSKLHHIGLRLALKKDWGIIVLLRDPRGIMSSYKNAGKRKGDFRTAESVLPFCLDFIKAVNKIKNAPNECNCD